MQIGIVGTGGMGTCLATNLVKLGHKVSIANQKNIPDLDKKLFEDLPEDVVVIDTGNYYPNLRDGKIAALEEKGVDSLWVRSLHFNIK
jgi:lactate dehydrogenase-like 2-hydroxyacid dehydrogenase